MAGDPKRPGTRFLAALPLFGIMVAIGCSRASPFRSIERSIQARLPRLIGPADRYQVTVSRSGAGLIAGRIPWIEIQGRNVRAIEGLTLDELEVRLEDVRFNRADRSVREIGQATFQARISAASATRFVRQRSPSLRDVEVCFVRDTVRVRASPRLLRIGVPMEVDGRPVLHSPTSINFDASRVTVLRLGLPEFAVVRLEARINPLIDLSAMPLPVHLSGARVEGDRAVVVGTATLNPAQLQ